MSHLPTGEARLQTHVQATALSIPEKSRSGKRPVLTALYRTVRVGKPEKTYTVTVMDDLSIVASRVCPAPKSGKEKNYIDRSASMRNTERVAAALLDLKRGVLVAAAPTGLTTRLLLFDLNRTRLSYLTSPKHIDLASCLTSEMVLDEPRVTHLCFAPGADRLAALTPRGLQVYYVANPDDKDEKAKSVLPAGAQIQPRSRSPSPYARRPGVALVAGPKLEVSAWRCCFSAVDPKTLLTIEQVGNASLVSEYHLVPDGSGNERLEKVMDPPPWKIRSQARPVGGEQGDPSRLVQAANLDETALSDYVSASQEGDGMGPRRAGVVAAGWEPQGLGLVVAHADGTLSLQHPDVASEDEGQTVVHWTDLNHACAKWGPELGFKPGFEPPLGHVSNLAWHASGALVSAATSTGWVFLLDCGLTVLRTLHARTLPDLPSAIQSTAAEPSLQVAHIHAAFSPIPDSLNEDHIRHVSDFPQTLLSQRLRLALAVHLPFQGLWHTAAVEVSMPSDSRLLRTTQIKASNLLAAHLAVDNRVAAARVVRGCFDERDRFRCLTQLVSHVFRRRNDPVTALDTLEDIYWQTYRYARYVTRDPEIRRSMRHVYIKICLYMVQNGELESAVKMTKQMATPIVYEAVYTAALRRGEVHFASIIYETLKERTTLATRTAKWFGNAPGDSTEGMGDPSRRQALIPKPIDILLATEILNGQLRIDDQTQREASEIKARAGL